MSVAAGKKPVGDESQRLNEAEGEAVTDVTGTAVRGNVVVFEGRVFPLRDCVVVFESHRGAPLSALRSGLLAVIAIASTSNSSASKARAVTGMSVLAGGFSPNTSRRFFTR